jgi:glucosyl-3-phosphoglycerate phosphatase
VLWRHGQTVWNLEHRFQGQTDIELDETGKTQAERAARLLAALKPGLIVSSDLSRAASTANALARLTGLTVSLDKDLRERGGGAWEGLDDAEIRERYPKEYGTWAPPGGEPIQAVADRVSAVLRRTASELSPGGLAVVVSHGAAIRIGLAKFLGIPDDLFAVLGPLSNCSWSMAGSTRDGGWRLLEHNAGTLPEPVLGDDR